VGSRADSSLLAHQKRDVGEFVQLLGARFAGREYFRAKIIVTFLFVSVGTVIVLVAGSKRR